MTDPRPNHRYYLANHGQWRGELRWTMTSWRAFRTHRMGLMDRLQVLSLVFTTWALGPLNMETEVDYHGQGPTTGDVVHLTRLGKWGVTLLKSREVFSLHGDGQEVGVRGERRSLPLWRAEGFGDSAARVHEDGRRASYAFPWFGTRIEQTVVILEEGHDRITMETPWMRGEAEVRRVPSAG